MVSSGTAARTVPSYPLAIWTVTLFVISLTTSPVFGVDASGQTLSYDVVVAGAGTGGVAAAIQAARMGVTVALLEETDWIGGQMATSAVGSMDEGTVDLRSSGFYQEFTSRVRAHYLAQGKSIGTCYFSSGSICVEPAVAQLILKQLINETRSRRLPNGQLPVLDLYLRTKVTSISKMGNTLTGLTTQTGLAFQSNVIIDATDYGDLLPLSGAEYRTGSSTSRNVNSEACIQDITYTAVIRKYPDGVPGELRVNNPPPGYADAKPLFENFVAKNGSPWWQSDGTIRFPVDWVFHNAYRGLPDSASAFDYTADPTQAPNITVTGVNWANDYPTNATLKVAYLEDSAYRSQASCEAKLKTLQFIYYLQHDLGETSWSIANDQGFNSPSNAEENSCPAIPAEFKAIEHHFPLRPYVREGRRVVGLHTLTAGEIKRVGIPPKAVQAFSSAVAMVDGRIDLHNCHTTPTLETELETTQDQLSGPGPGFFQIPFESFIPAEIDGLLVAEKNLSVSRLVNGATRLQPSTMLTGQAAGAIAALAAQQTVRPRQVTPIDVQNALLDARVILSPYSFADVSQSHSFWKYTQLASLYDIFLGYGDGTFGVNDPLTRRQLAVILVKSFRLPSGDVPATPSFVDVPATDSGYPFIEALYRSGVTGGCAANPRTFCPDNYISRVEIAVMMVRAMQLNLADAPTSPFFTDVAPSHWAFRHIQLFAQKGISTGCATTLFCPSDLVTRGQAAAFLTRELMNR